MAKKTPNYGLRRGVAASVATGVLAGLGSAANASHNTVSRLMDAGLDATPQDVQNHIVGSGVLGAVSATALAGAYLGGKAIVNKVKKNRNLGRQF